MDRLLDNMMPSSEPLLVIKITNLRLILLSQAELPLTSGWSSLTALPLVNCCSHRGIHILLEGNLEFQKC